MILLKFLLHNEEIIILILNVPLLIHTVTVVYEQVLLVKRFEHYSTVLVVHTTYLLYVNMNIQVQYCTEMNILSIDRCILGHLLQVAR